MRELKLSKQEAIQLYPKSPEFFQKTLIATFGAETFSGKITDRIKTFEDACEVSNINSQSLFNMNDSQDEIAYKKLKLIIQVLNEGWTPDWNNKSQQKWYVWFKLSSGFGFDDTFCFYGSTCTGVGSRLCFKSNELATYAATQFTEIYKQFLV